MVEMPPSPATAEIISDSCDSSSSVYSLLVRILAYAYCANAFVALDADTDLWGHLKYGELMWTTRSIPPVDSYSYTAQGATWINHEWLSEVFYYLLYRAFDTTGLLIFKLLLGLLIVHILSGLYFSKEKDLLPYGIHFFFMPHVIALGFMTRPHLLTFLFLTLLMYVLHKFFDGNRRILIWTPLIMLLWANCHGGVVAGIGIYGVVTVCELIRCHFKGGDEGKTLLKYFIPSCLAVLANPYGYKLWTFFLETIPAERAITEWEGIPLISMRFIYFKIMVLLFAASLFTSSTKRLWELAVIAIGIFFAFRHLRHTVLAAILLTPYLPVHLAAMGLKISNITHFRPSRQWHAVFHSVLIIMIAAQTYSHFSKYQEANFKIQVDPVEYPVYAARFMKMNDINGNILNPFNWGEYLIWHLPKSKVAIDGRMETVYPNKTFIQTLVFNYGWEGWQYVPDLYPATEIILTDKFNKGIEQKPEWVKIYEDPTAAILVRKTGSPGPILAKFYDKQLVDTNDPPSRDFP